MANSLRIDGELVTATTADCEGRPFLNISKCVKLNRQNYSLYVQVGVYIFLAKTKKALPKPPPSAATKAARLEATQNINGSGCYGNPFTQLDSQSSSNEEVLREKARVRMVACCKALKESGEVSDEHSARRKEADARYRAKYRKARIWLPCSALGVKKHSLPSMGWPRTGSGLRRPMQGRMQLGRKERSVGAGHLVLRKIRVLVELSVDLTSTQMTGPVCRATVSRLLSTTTSSMSRPCIPTYRPSVGDEDYEKISSTAGRFFYVVGSGFKTGIFTNDRVARNQINKFSNGQWKRAATYAEAILTWNDMCAAYHQHSNASSPPSTPSPPPSPPHLAPSAPARHVSLPASPILRQLPVMAAPPAAVGHHRSPSLSPSKLARAPASSATPRRSSPTVRVVPSASACRLVQSTRNPGEWRLGDTLWGIEGHTLLFEDSEGVQGLTVFSRYDLVDHIYAQRLSPARLMESRNRQRLEAFVQGRGDEVGGG
ncbi:hypothetical protein B0H14DRAFT_2591527 [Mycena olivaceomarginata]|nr:hypothetical protein B0H14DRAFT_2591527 [Mycena olivaceomarginata]